ncbi:MAG TPA: peptidoglycan DD-metalloendopeptidase family protein [Arthrobacter sp.]
MTFIWPWPKGTEISQAYGASPGGVNPSGGHTGIDGKLPVGTPLRAPADGTIVWADWCTTTGGTDNPWLLTKGGGICVVLDAGPGKPNFILAHLSRTDLNKGDKVKQGDIIAYSGNTGTWTTGPHCHFEVMIDGYNLKSSTYGRYNPASVCSAFWEDTISLQPASSGYRYWTAGKDNVNQRAAPNTSSPVVRIIQAGSKEVWDAYVHGETVAGTDIWYADSLGYASAAFFDPLTTTGLVDRTPAAPAPTAPVQEPTAPVVQKYDFALDFGSINGIAVEKIPAQWDNYGEEFTNKPAKAVLHWWNDPAVNPALSSVINEFCNISTSKSAHFIVSDARIIQVVSLNDRAFHAGPGGNDWIGIEVDPRATLKNADGTYTARALVIQANVRALLAALRSKYGYQLGLTLHKNVPGAATSCSGLDLADYDITPPPAPPAPAPATDDIGTLRRFFEWLIALFLARPR